MARVQLIFQPAEKELTMSGIGKDKIDLLRQVFADAVVLDMDWSEWDTRIGLCVIGCDAEWPLPKRLPLFLVDFVRVSRLECSFKHLDVKREAPFNWGHFQWNVSGLLYEWTDGTCELQLVGSGNSPDMSLSCEDVLIRRLDHEVLDKSFPGWTRPGSAFVRPGIEAMHPK